MGIYTLALAKRSNFCLGRILFLTYSLILSRMTICQVSPQNTCNPQCVGHQREPHVLLFIFFFPLFSPFSFLDTKMCPQIGFEVHWSTDFFKITPFFPHHLCWARHKAEG